MKVFLVRHPQTIWNKKGLFQGVKEGKISKDGRLEAGKFLEITKKVEINSIYYAANERCEYLALKLSRVHPQAKIIKDRRLNERSFGDYEGLPEKGAARLTNFNPKDYEIERFNWKPPKGESLKNISFRVRDFLNDIGGKKEVNRNVFVITSGGVIKVALFILGLKTLKEIFESSVGNLETIEIDLKRCKPTNQFLRLDTLD